MKHICLFSTLLLCVQGELNEADRRQIGLDCVKETGIDKKIIDQAVDTATASNHPKYKEFLTCSYKKQGYQNEKGEILMSEIKKFLRKFYTVQELTTLDTCTGYVHPNHGENAVNALQCILPKLKELD